jgi:AraC-like protein
VPPGDRTLGGGAIVTEFRTADLPAAERFGFWHDLPANALIPTVITSAHLNDFRAALRALDLDTVHVAAMTCPSMRSLRKAKLVRCSDPEVYQVVLTSRGSAHRSGREMDMG